MMSDNTEIKDAAALEYKQHKVSQKLLKFAKKTKASKEVEV
jgi:hypothetical protein